MTPRLDASIDPTLITLRSLAGRWQGASITGQGALPWRVILGSAPARFAAWLQALPSEPARATLTVRADHVTQAVLDGLVAPGQLHDVQGEASAKRNERFSFTSRVRCRNWPTSAHAAQARHLSTFVLTAGQRST